jgi:hypothetical protein
MKPKKKKAPRGIWTYLTEAGRKRYAAKLAKVHWKNVPAKERTKRMRKLAQLPRPSRYIQDRCPCGKYSSWLAAKRGHKCKAA